MARYRIQVADKQGRILGYKHVSAPSLKSILEQQGKHVNVQTRTIRKVYRGYKKRKSRHGGLIDFAGDIRL